MSFLTSQTDLSGTIFEGQKLQEIREYLIAEIKKVAEEWLDNPVGELGEYWKQDSDYATLYLVWLTNMLIVINRSITEKSISKAQKKFKSLLFSSSLSVFTQNLTELEVACGLANFVSPLALEPLASDEAFFKGNPPRSPDFAFQLPGRQVVFVEATVWYFDLLRKWDEAVNHIYTIIRNRLLRQGRTLRIALQLPLQEFKPDQIIKITKHAWSKISSSDSGQLTVVKGGTIRWSPYPVNPILESPLSLVPTSSSTEAIFQVTSLDNAPSFMTVTPSKLSFSPNTQVDWAFVSQRDIAISDKDKQTNELVYESFRQKLKNKRTQFRYDAPYILVMKSGHFRLLDNNLLRMIEQQIWTRRDYEWMTGMILFTSRKGFLQSDPNPLFLFTLNPHARIPANDDLKSVLEGKAQFHFNGPAEPTD